jgi:hypothetical protein
MAKKISMIPEGQKAPTVAQVAADMGVYGKAFIANMKKQGYGLNDELIDKTATAVNPMGALNEKTAEPNEYFFVADFDPEDENMFDNEMFGEPSAYSPEGLQEAIAKLEEAKGSGASNYNIYRRKMNQGDSEEEIISDPFNYQFPKKK